MAQHTFKQGDPFVNEGGWRGSIIAIEGENAIVRFHGEDPRRIETIPLTKIKPVLY